MGSLHLCNIMRANVQQTGAISVTHKTTSTSYNATQMKLNYSLGNQFLVSKQTVKGYHIVNSIEPCLSSSSAIHHDPLKIGIIGMGEFGQFLASAFRRQGHNVLGTSRSDYSEFCKEHGVEFFRDMDGMCEAQPDVLLLCSSILSTESIVSKIPFHKLKPDTIIADVLSVKQFPKNLLSDVVPSGFGILCTHPMFGKFSGKSSWEGLRFVYEKVRLAQDCMQEGKCERFLNIFQDEGCQMVEMSCEEHDQHAAESQFITHTVARILSNMNLESTPIDTKGYEALLELTQNTTSHSSDLYDGLFMYNVNAAEQIEKFDIAFDMVKEKLYMSVREKLTKAIEENIKLGERIETSHSSHFIKSSATIEKLSGFFWNQNQENQDSSMEQRNKDQHATL